MSNTVKIEDYLEIGLDESDALNEWFNLAEIDQDALEILKDNVDAGNISFTECDKCGDTKVNSTGITDWDNFQGVAYEGSGTYEYAEGHFIGDSPAIINVCRDCG